MFKLEILSSLSITSADLVKEQCTVESFLANVPAWELSLAQRCLELIIDSLRQNIAGLSDKTMPNIEVADLEERVKDALPGELRYAYLQPNMQMKSI